MPTRAFLLSPDERALDAITQILSELEVSFELFHDPSTAAKRVSSQHFDLLFVDCDNEQHGSHVFASARKSDANQAPIAIAIVDGKNGVASAFRLGASLVLSKPVSMEQARGTVRNALAILRKAVPETKPMPAPQSAPASTAAAKVESTVAVSPTARVQPAPKPPSVAAPP